MGGAQGPNGWVALPAMIRQLGGGFGGMWEARRWTRRAGAQEVDKEA
jgi:hypothetical protein